MGIIDNLLFGFQDVLEKCFFMPPKFFVGMEIDLINASVILGIKLRAASSTRRYADVKAI